MTQDLCTSLCKSNCIDMNNNTCMTNSKTFCWSLGDLGELVKGTHKQRCIWFYYPITPRRQSIRQVRMCVVFSGMYVTNIELFNFSYLVLLWERNLTEVWLLLWTRVVRITRICQVTTFEWKSWKTNACYFTVITFLGRTRFCRLSVDGLLSIINRAMPCFWFIYCKLFPPQFTGQTVSS